MCRLIAWFVLFAGVLPAQDTDFRGHQWGDGRDAVVAAEGAPPDHEEHRGRVRLLEYDVEIGGLHQARCRMYFVDDDLAEGAYHFREHFTEPTLYIERAERLADLLSKKYGSADPQFEWRNDLYRDTEELGKALESGHLTILWIWRIPGTIIMQRLDGANFEVSHTLGYVSEAFTQRFQQQMQKNQLEDF